MNSKRAQHALAAEMLEFAMRIPSSAGLEWVKDPDYLYFFEAERLLTMRALLTELGFTATSEFDVLDVGYLHGIVPEFLHRHFRKARFTVIDHPDSPIFRNPDYQGLVGTRSYLKLTPLNITDAARLERRFKVVVMGEIIEHLDPSFAVHSINEIAKVLEHDGFLVITTPNANGIVNLYTQFRGRDVAHPVIPDDTMNWPHIHLWSPTLLAKTLLHHGWDLRSIRFNHGFEALRQAQMNRRPSGIIGQLPQRMLWHLSQVIPRFRGYFVAVFSKDTAQPKNDPRTS